MLSEFQTIGTFLDYIGHNIPIIIIFLIGLIRIEHRLTKLETTCRLRCTQTKKEGG